MSNEAAEAVAAMIAELDAGRPEREAEWTRRQAAKKAERAEFKRRRDYGLVRRHAAKAAHFQAARDDAAGPGAVV